ncbi:hypothetical protein DCAR_0205808 [Daucus carota subsp. sativus]|uniref:Uncharacterized protein n=1 Tax=Daucus carota subsp. sativus TaxID=79200 RepID=A0A166CT98_DAUCS|nr:hypothetical protein DCAR_0205808 [Daucus carota subsp. sativus]
MGIFGSTIPEWFTYRLRNHYIFCGHCEFLERKLSGLRSICEGLRLVDFDKLELLVNTYNGGRNFKLSLFDGTNVEIGLDLTAITSGHLVFTFLYPCYFNLEVNPSHMLTYCHDVDIPVQFKRLTELWKSKDTFHVYKGSLS